MSANYQGVSSPAQDLFVDSLDSEIEESLKDPQYRASHEDASERYDVIDRLVHLRKERKLTQKQVAERMGVGQSTIAGFENEGSDPRLSTIQRYARAVEARCAVSIQVTAECDWVRPSGRYLSAPAQHSTRVNLAEMDAHNAAWGAANAKRNDFSLAA